ncbi:unnamed protein product [Triticum turgidum subsp. durum]|uniref:Uncharacterized protein n=1 Tax=Triticum turgidum subsp. durum TaxID=4567 RepID=A0A9R0VJM8_TRITD|nr:unnamed protein product [Triticum turgidum subsp. durum]
MSLQIPARSRSLRRLLLLGGESGIRRSYSTGDRRRRVIHEARDEEEDEAFLRTLNFGADPENNPLPPPLRRAGGAPDPSATGAFPGDKLVRSFQDRNFAIDEKSIREHLDKKGPFSPIVWEVIFGKKKTSRPF